MIFLSVVNNIFLPHLGCFGQRAKTFSQGRLTVLIGKVDKSGLKNGTFRGQNRLEPVQVFLTFA